MAGGIGLMAGRGRGYGLRAAGIGFVAGGTGLMAGRSGLAAGGFLPSPVRGGLAPRRGARPGPSAPAAAPAAAPPLLPRGIGLMAGRLGPVPRRRDFAMLHS